MNNKNLIIAIDGPAASGKGTLARSLAEKLELAYLDTGSLYRAAAYEVLKADGNPEDENDSVKGAETLKTALEQAAAPSIILNNKSLREEKVGEAASKVAAIPAVRDALLQLQRDFAASPPAPYKGAILDGRDIGTIVCPDADLKLFVTASIEIRAKRRLKELQSADKGATYEAVLRDMQIRDERDSVRNQAPLKAASDAVKLDTSNLTASQALERALEIFEQKITRT